MKVNDLEWATFLYNAMGEDGSYLTHVKNVNKHLECEKLGNEIVDFLNHWRMRVPKENLSKQLTVWYSKIGKEKIKALQCDDFLKLNLNDEEVTKNISELYDSLLSRSNSNPEKYNMVKTEKISDTAASKILHILKPSLFMMWDNNIREYYINDKYKDGPKAYILFMKKMQEFAFTLQEECPDVTKRLNEKVSIFYEEESSTEASNGYKKPITKFLDEYNWIKITKQVKIPPPWYPENVDSR